MQKLIKLNDQHYIIVNDSEIKEGDWVCNIQKPYIKQCQDIDVDYYNKRNDVFKKITHSTEPLEYKYGSQKHGFNMGVMSSDIKLVYDQIKPLDLSEVEEAINGYSVENAAYHFCDNVVHPKDETQSLYFAFCTGFKAHQELVKDKLFTVEDMRKAMWEVDRLKTTNLTTENFSKLVDKYIQSLLPKTEWECIIHEQVKISLAL